MESKSFELFGFSPVLISSLKKLGYQKPTLIQESSIPYFMQGKDLVIRADSGSGKTLTYLLPIFNHFISNKNVAALILTPNTKICEHVYNLSSKLTNIQGSSSYTNNGIYEIRSNFAHSWNLIISTPLRALSYLSNNPSLPDTIKFLVIDDFDLIMQMDLLVSVKNILNLMTSATQLILSSRPLNADFLPLENIFSGSRTFIKISDLTKPEHCLRQFYLKFDTADDKFSTIFAMFKLKLFKGKVLIFVNKVQQGYKLAVFLGKLAIKSAFYNPRLPITSCSKILEEFNSNKFNFLILFHISQHCLPTAIDVTKVIDFAIHFDSPFSISEYSDRISCANFNNSITFCTGDEFVAFSRIIEIASDHQVIRPYDLKMLNNFKYRCKDVLRSITKKSISNVIMSDFKKHFSNINKK
jgi:ATP-dependent RNA helicase DDX56/DBP9